MSSKMISALVRDDGFTRDVFIREIKGLYPDVKFAYRPTTLKQRSDFWDWNDSLKRTHQKDSAAAEMMANKIVSWDIVDHEGKDVSVTKENILKIHPDLFVRMKNIICFSVDGGDFEEGEHASSNEDTEKMGDEFIASLQKNS